MAAKPSTTDLDQAESEIGACCCNGLEESMTASKAVRPLLTSSGSISSRRSRVVAAPVKHADRRLGPVTIILYRPWILKTPASTSASERIGVEISCLSRSLRANNSSWIFDLGVEIRGVIYVNYTLSGSPATLGLALTDSKIWIGQRSENSNGVTDPDLIHYRILLRDTVGVELEISFQPTWSDLKAYQGYFHSDDEIPNKICSPAASCLTQVLHGLAALPIFIIWMVGTCNYVIACLVSLTGSHKHFSAEYLSDAADLTKVIKAHLRDSEKGALTDTPTKRLVYPSRRQQYGCSFDVLEFKSAEAAFISKYLTVN
ncbi:hypothetical protein DL771_003325 [Monosporascus sp. 5C6A]|nr:hypothetical protein DL771_003325 [Monosporascus sp. 5C6A]